MMMRYLVRFSRVRIISIRTRVTISISNQSLTIARLLHSARDNVEHLFNISELQLIHMFSFLTRRGFIKQNSGDIEYAVARTIVLTSSWKEGTIHQRPDTCQYQRIRLLNDQETS